MTENILVSSKKRNKVAPGSEARLVYNKNKEPLIIETEVCWAQVTGNIITIYFTEKEINLFNRICKLSEIEQVWEDPEEPFYNFIIKDNLDFPKNLIEFDGKFEIEIKGVWYTEQGNGISAKLLKYEVVNDYSESFDSESAIGLLDEIIPADID
jgi:hypothetical protein